MAKKDGTEIINGAEFVGDSFSLALVPFSNSLEGLPHTEAVRSGVIKLAEVGGKLDVMAGCLLAEVRDNGYWKEWTKLDSSTGLERPFLSFEDYLDTEVPFKRRKAFYLMSIYDKFVVELRIPMEYLRTAEWSKIKELIPIITEKNWKRLFRAIEKMSVRDVIAMVASERSSTKLSLTSDEAEHAKVDSEIDADMEEVAKLVVMKFSLFPAQAENLKTALKIAGNESGSEKVGHLIDLIATDFIAGRVSESVGGIEALCGRLDVVLQSIERAFGVKLEVTPTTIKV